MIYNKYFSQHGKKFKNVFALTGGIGCGKSTTLESFRSLGCIVIDSDKLCHVLYSKKNFLDKIKTKWGSSIIVKGKANRKKIADIVFKNKTDMEWLNSITHFEIFGQALEIIKSCKIKETIIFDIPLLFELKIENFFKATISVWTNKSRQRERLKIRNNWTDREIDLRLNSQLPSDTKLEKATYGIINTGNLELLNIQCKNFFLILERLKTNNE